MFGNERTYEKEGLLHTQEVRSSTLRAPTTPPSKHNDLGVVFPDNVIQFTSKNKQSAHDFGPHLDRRTA